MKSSIPQWLPYDNTDLVKFRSLKIDYAGTQIYGFDKWLCGHQIYGKRL